MYEISSCYDRGFLIDEIMLYLIMYELFHDPYGGALSSPLLIAQVGMLCAGVMDYEF